MPFRCSPHKGVLHTFYFRGFAILSFAFRFSLLLLCLYCKVRDWHKSRCVRITQSTAAPLYFSSQHEKTVPIVAEEMSQVLFYIVTGIKGAMVFWQNAI